MSGSDAQAGFYYQNVLGALYALDLIELGSQLSSISFDNPSRAKYIDDIVAEGRQFAQFVQVKWSQNSDTSFTFANLTAADDGSSESLLSKLAAGFRQIANTPGTKRVILYSPRKAAATAQPAKGFNKSLASFIEDFHNPFREDDSNRELQKARNYSEYKQVLDALFPLTGFADRPNFANFLKCLRFDLSQPDRDSLLLRLRMRLARLGIGERQSALLINKVVEWSIDQTVVRSEDVLRELGLRDRFVDSLKQNFPIDIDRIVPVPTVIQGVSTALDSLPSGYILLEGEPGVGKSTALSMLRAYRRDVTFEYFCFIPNEHSIGNRRLDSASFIRSLCIGLRNAFPDLEFPQTFAEFSKATLDDWLNFLSRQELRVILVVDGLDYVDSKSRQGMVTSPLTTVLDGMLPPGIFMILGSQYLEALSPQVQDEVRGDPRRRIKVRRFDPPQTEEFFGLRHIRLSNKNLTLAHEISGGVPIYLEYIASELVDLNDYEQERYLESVPSIRDKRIDAYHSHLWNALQQDDIAVHILALLAIRQDFTTVDDLAELLAIMKVPATIVSIGAALKLITHVLRVSDAQGYAIRHESFREFVAEKTSSLTQTLNAVLNQWYADHPATNEAWRHRFRHLYELKHFSELIAACDDAWLRKSWSQFRPFAEINQNIDFAWNAASELTDLTQFVRIALMRQRISLVKEHLGRSEAEIGQFLLELGHPREALLRVWDGERAISGQVAFAQFCLYHKKIIGRPPSIDVMRQGLGEALPSGLSPDDLRVYYRACTYTSDPENLIAQAAVFSWTEKDEPQLRINRLNSQQNSAINRRIQFGIVDELFRQRANGALMKIAESSAVPAEVRQVSYLAAVAGIAQIGERGEATKLLPDLRVDLLPLETTSPYMIILAESGIDIADFAKGADKPQLPEALFGPRSMELNELIYEVYDRLRLFCLADPNAIPWLEARVSGMPRAVAALLLAFGRLAKLWSDWVATRQGTNSPQPSDFAEIAGAILRVRQYLKDPGENGYLYARALPDFLQYVWDGVTKALAGARLTEFARLWIELDAGRATPPPPEATRNLAICLSSGLGRQSAAVNDLLRMAEGASRAEEETSVITSELLATASAWGRCGFLDDAQRIWGELLDIACGVYWRKDYQFNEVLKAMELAHRQDPGGTLNRISEQLVLAHQLTEAARSKTVAVAIEELIAFSVNISPSLSLQMLWKEDESVFRERAIRDLLPKLLADDSIDPYLLWSLASTMNIWEDYQAFRDETLPALRSIYESSVQRHLVPTTETIYCHARHLLLVQKNMASELGIWADIWVGAGDAPAQVRADRDRYTVVSEEREPEETVVFLTEPDMAKLDEAAGRSITDLDREMDALERDIFSQERRRELDNLKNEWDRLFQSTLGRKSTVDEERTFDVGFQGFEERLVIITRADRVTTEQQVRQALGEFVSELRSQLNTTADLLDFVSAFDVDAWLKRFLHNGPPRYSMRRVLEKRLPQWIAAARYTDLPGWVDFCRRRCWGEVKGNALYTIAMRMKSVDRPGAMRLLIEAWESSAEFFFMHTQMARSICSDAISLDKDRGIKLLFDSFSEYHKRYPQSIVHNLDEVLRFADQFPATDILQLYAVWSDYNRNLTAGLSVKPVDIAWIRDDLPATFSESCIQYLVRLLDYPEIDIRLLAENACYGLLMENTAAPSSVISLWPGLNATQKEHLTSLLFSYALARPEKVQGWSPALLAFVNEETQFNIRQTASELVSAVESAGTALSQSIHDQAKRLTERQSVTVPGRADVQIPQNRGIPCLPYTRFLIDKLKEIAPSESVDVRLLSFVLRHYGDPRTGFAEEGATHRAHNINSNFDSIEISGRYDQTVRAGINDTLEGFVRSNRVERKKALRYSPLLRVEDPTDRLVVTTEKPANIDWIDSRLSAEEFVNFADWDKLLLRVGSLATCWITLFEETEQRTGEKTSSEPSRATKVYLSLFYTPESEMRIGLDDLDNAQPISRNQYRFELRSAECRKSRSSTADETTSLVQLSVRSFRGRVRPSTAALRPTIAEEMGLQLNDADLFGYERNENAMVRSTEWQEAFDQGRRRHEPLSSGFLLEIERGTLRDWIVKNGLTLWAELHIERTADRYKPENEMNWTERTGRIEVKLA